MRNLALPCGTVGGRIALSQMPCFFSEALINMALSESPIISGCMAVLDGNKVKPAPTAGLLMDLGSGPGWFHSKLKQHCVIACFVLGNEDLR